MEDRTKLFLGVGHPRTGTGYTAKLLQLWGFDVGHERVGRDGVVAWYAYEDTPPQCEPISLFESPLHKIHVVRRAKPAVASIIYAEGATKEYRMKKLGLEPTGDEVQDAINSYLGWTYRIRREFRIDHVFRIEEGVHDLYRFVNSVRSCEFVDFRERVNSRRDRQPRHINRILSPYKDQFAMIDRVHGYLE